MDTTAQSPQSAESAFGQYRHICAFFNSFDEDYRVLRLFIKDGFDHGDKAFHLIDPERPTGCWWPLKRCGQHLRY